MNRLILSVILILAFIVIYAVLIEIFSVLFRISGLTKEKARFQAISLLTSVGYSTSESEAIMKDENRRKIAIVAMITGYSFSVAIMSLLINLFLSFDTDQTENSLTVIIIAFLVFMILMIVLRLPVVKNLFDSLIERAAMGVLKKKGRFNSISVLDTFGNECICEIDIKAVPKFLLHKSLYESHIKDMYNMNVLMINRKGRILDANASSMIQKNDSILVFGDYENIMKTFGTDMKNLEKSLNVEDKINDNTIDLINNYGKDAMAEIRVNRVPEFLEEKTLFDSHLKDAYEINVLMVKRESTPLRVDKDTMILKGDIIIVLGPYMEIRRAFLKKQDTNQQAASESGEKNDRT